MRGIGRERKKEYYKRESIFKALLTRFESKFFHSTDFVYCSLMNRKVGPNKCCIHSSGASQLFDAELHDHRSETERKKIKHSLC